MATRHYQCAVATRKIRKVLDQCNKINIHIKQLPELSYKRIHKHRDLRRMIIIKADIIMDLCRLCLIKMNIINQTRNIIGKLQRGLSDEALIITNKVTSENQLLFNLVYMILRMGVLLLRHVYSVRRHLLVKVATSTKQQSHLATSLVLIFPNRTLMKPHQCHPHPQTIKDKAQIPTVSRLISKITSKNHHTKDKPRKEVTNKAPTMTDLQHHKADTSSNNVSLECMLILRTILRHHTLDKALSHTAPSIPKVHNISSDKSLIITEDTRLANLSRVCKGNNLMALSSSNSRMVANTRPRHTIGSHPESRTNHHLPHSMVVNLLEIKTSLHSQHPTGDSHPATRTSIHNRTTLHSPVESTVSMIYSHRLKIFKIPTTAISYFHVPQTIDTKVIVV